MTKKKIPVHLIGQALKRKLKPIELDPGEYLLNGVARVELRCSIAKGEPQDGKEPLKLNWLSILASVLRQGGVHPENAKVWLARAIAEQPYKASVDAHTAVVEKFVKALYALQPKKPKEGATKVSGLVEVVGWNG